MKRFFAAVVWHSAFVVLLVAIVGRASGAEPPDGTLLFYRSDTLGGRALHRHLGDPHCHVSIVLDGFVFEAAPPFVRSQPLRGYRFGRMTYDQYRPRRPFSPLDVSKMRFEAQRQLGRPYRLRQYFHPGSRRDPGTWCSRFTADVLGASDRYEFHYDQYHQPQDLFHAIQKDYYRWQP